jgi:hypothetical protein
MEQLIKFETFSNVRTIKIFLNQLLSYQSIRIENTLAQTGKIDYESLVTLKKQDFSHFVADDFINIIGSENVKLHTK